MPLLTIVQAVNLALHEEMQRDDKVIVLGEDVGVNGGVFRATEGLIDKFPNRVFDTPLAETAIAGVSIGLAVNGFKPVAEIQFEGFSYSTLDQMINHAARIRNRSRGRYTCPMVLRFPYSGGIHAPEHHSDSPEAYYVHTPGLKVVIPSTPYDTKGLLKSAIRDPDPVVFMEPKKIYRAVKEEVPEDDYTIPIGEAKIRKEGNDVTIITYGAMTIPVLQAAKELEGKVSCEVIDLRTLSPIDEDTIIKSVRRTGRVVIVHEAPKTAGVGAEISAVINEKAIMYLEAPISRVTGYDIIMPLYKLENYYLPDAERIKNNIEKVAGF